LALFICYVVVTILTIAANIFSAVLDYIKYEQVLINMAKANVPASWLYTLGTLKAAGVLGLIIGFFIPWIGLLAAFCLTLFFIAAIITHLRVRDYSFGLAIVFLLLAIGSLTLGLSI
jgi:hypothetical protein